MSDDTLVTTLRGRVRGTVHAPGDPEYDDERTGFQRAAAHAPAAIVSAADAGDVRAAVATAAERGLPVAAQSSGHGLARPLDGGILVSTRATTGVAVDPDARTATIEAGASWQQVVAAAAPYGLAPLSGSAPGVGAVSYTLGGGIGLLARGYGLAADRLRSADLVTADGELRHVTADTDPELMWALRGGGGGLGLVTRMTVELVPVTGLYGGGLYAEATPEVLAVWHGWAADLGRETTAAVALINMPDLPMVPEELRGRHVAQVQVAHSGPRATGERAVAPLREALGPLLRDTLHEMPFTESATAFEEPDFPHAYRADCRLVDDLDPGALAGLPAVGGPSAALPTVVILRRLGGALAEPPVEPSAAGHRDAGYALVVLAVVEPGQEDAARALQADAFAPFESRALGRTLNFCYGPLAPDQVRTGFEPDAWERLVALKARHDPENRIRANHEIPVSR